MTGQLQESGAAPALIHLPRGISRVPIDGLEVIRDVPIGEVLKLATQPGLLKAYRRWSPSDPGLSERVTWYEQMTLLRKIRFLASNTERHPGAEALHRRQAEAVQLLNELAEEFPVR